MTSMTAQQRERYLELVAGLHLDELSAEEHAELEALSARAGDDPEMGELVGRLIVAFDEAGDRLDAPQAVKARLIERGRRMVARPPRRYRWLAAACVVLAAGTVIVAGVAIQGQRQAASARAQVAALEARIESNATVIATAQRRVVDLNEQLQAEMSDRLALAERLADATAALDRAELTIAQYEAPVDPATLAQHREKLLEVPGTIRLAWSPFDLPDAPAEQREVTGDVVWNDELEQGFLRFVGLDVNDPAVEQYQVWVIDERGMEQKVSGGVFNATAQGEVIVPIDPAIDVRRVALFAVTVEEPGGTWVPDLTRRVVVAPRG